MLRAPKICIELGKYGLLAFRSPSNLKRSPLIRLADAFEIKNPATLLALDKARTGQPPYSDELAARLHILRELGKEFTFHGEGIVNDGFADTYLTSAPSGTPLTGKFEPNGIDFASFTLGPASRLVSHFVVDGIHYWSAPTGTALSRAECLQRAEARVRQIRGSFRGRLALENEVLLPGVTEAVVGTDFISEFFNKNPGVGFLLDIPHAMVTAARSGIDIHDYLQALPLSRIAEIHLSRPRAVDGELHDAHDPPSLREFDLFDAVLTAGARPNYVTVEYHRDEDRLVAANQTLRAFFRPRVRSLLDKSLVWLGLALAETRESLAGVTRYDRQRIEKIIARDFSPYVRRMLAEVLSQTPTTAQARESVNDLTAHLARVRLAYHQATQASFDELRTSPEPHQLEKIAAGPDETRGRGNFAALRARINKYGTAIWEALIVLHDVGKIIQAPLHDRVSGRVIRRHGMLNQFPFNRFSKRARAVFAEVIEHHNTFGVVFLGEASPILFRKVFECPRLRAIAEKPDGSVNLRTVEMFLGLLAPFSCIDSSGVGPWGVTSNSRIESWFEFAYELYAIFKRNQYSYAAALEKIENLAQGNFLRRLSGQLAVYDTGIDEKLRPSTETGGAVDYSFYSDRIKRSVERLIARGEITRGDWQELAAAFHNIVELPYVPFFSTIAWSNPMQDPRNPGEADEIYDGYVKILILLNRAASARHGAPCREIRVIAPGNRVVRMPQDTASCMPALRTVLDQTRGLHQEGERIYFADADGNRVEQGPVISRQGNSLIVDFSHLESTGIKDL